MGEGRMVAPCLPASLPASDDGDPTLSGSSDSHMSWAAAAVAIVDAAVAPLRTDVGVAKAIERFN